MKLKRTMAVILSAATLGATAYAADVRVSVDGTTVTIQAETEKKSKANIIVSRNGEDIYDNDYIYEMIQVTADDNGKIVHTFILPEERNGVSNYGEYDVLVKPENGDMQTGLFAFVTAEDIERLMEALKADDADFAEIFDKDSEYRTSLKSIGCAMDMYDALENPGAVAELFAGAFTDDADKDDVKNVLSSAIVVGSISDEESAESALSEYSPKFEGKEYLDFDDEQQEWVSKTLPGYAPFESVADFEAKYAVANILYLINNAKFDRLTDLFDKYAKELGIEDDSDYEDYLDLSNSKKVKANEEIVKDLKSNPVSTAKALCDVIEDAVSAVNKKSGGGSSGGSSSGGGSTGGGIITPGPSQITPDVNVVEETDDFTDLGNVSWAENAILKLRDAGIVSGRGNGIFAPTDTVTREEFTAMVINAAGLYDANASAEFDDVSTSDWCYRYIASALNNKVVFGVSATNFGKGTNISRQDMAVIAYRAAKDSGRIHVGRAMENFADQNKISEYAQDAIEALYKTGVINGSDGYYRPLDTATRAEAAVIIYNLFVK